LEGENVVETDKCMDVSQILGAFLALAYGAGGQSTLAVSSSHHECAIGVLIITEFDIECS